jgi:uncharacterized protein YdhG (YjbR/CyaY superfamily)
MKAESVDEYLAQLSESQRTEIQRLMRITKELAPNSEIMISYGMPTFKHKGKPLVYFGAFKDHMSVFPASSRVINSLSKELKEFKMSKGTVQFTLTKPLPADVFNQIVQLRMEEIEASAK